LVIFKSAGFDNHIQNAIKNTKMFARQGQKSKNVGLLHDNPIPSTGQ